MNIKFLALLVGLQQEALNCLYYNHLVLPCSVSASLICREIVESIIMYLQVCGLLNLLDLAKQLWIHQHVDEVVSLSADHLIPVYRTTKEAV